MTEDQQREQRAIIHLHRAGWLVGSRLEISRFHMSSRIEE
jgi:hypothetical protein